MNVVPINVDRLSRVLETTYAKPCGVCGIKERRLATASRGCVAFTVCDRCSGRVYVNGRSRRHDVSGEGAANAAPSTMPSSECIVSTLTKENQPAMTTKNPQTSTTHVRPGGAVKRAAGVRAKVDANAAAVAAINAKLPNDGSVIVEWQNKQVMVRELDRVAIITIASAEAKAKKEAKRTGTTIPATPVLDYMNGADYVNTKGTSSKSKGGTKASAPKVTVAMFTGASDLSSGRHNRLSAIAARNKTSIADFRKLLDAAKISEPETTSWTLTMPSGVIVGARPVGKPIPAEAVASAKRTTSTKPATKKPTTKATTKATAPAKKATKATAKATAGPKPVNPAAAAQKALDQRRNGVKIDRTKIAAAAKTVTKAQASRRKAS